MTPRCCYLMSTVGLARLWWAWHLGRPRHARGGLGDIWLKWRLEDSQPLGGLRSWQLCKAAPDVSVHNATWSAALVFVSSVRRSAEPLKPYSLRSVTTEAWGQDAAGMLQVGNGKLTPTEQRAHFALWALLKAPLLIGTDLRTASEGARELQAEHLGNSSKICVLTEQRVHFALWALLKAPLLIGTDLRTASAGGHEVLQYRYSGGCCGRAAKPIRKATVLEAAAHQRHPAHSVGKCRTAGRGPCCQHVLQIGSTPRIVW